MLIHWRDSTNVDSRVTDVVIVKYFAQAPDLSKMIPLQKPAQYI